MGMDRDLWKYIDFSSIVRDNGGNGGEPPMDKYVTYQELEANTEKILHRMDNQFAELNDNLKTEFNKNEIELHDIKNTAISNKEKINWLLYTVVGGIAISVITTIISNLVTK